MGSRPWSSSPGRWLPEEHAFAREPRERGRGLAPVAVGLQTVAAQGVRQHEEDAARPAVARRTQAAHRRASEEPRRARPLRRHRERELDRAPRPLREVDGRRLPQVGRGDGPLEHVSRVAVGGAKVHAEGHRPGVERPHGEVEARSLRERERVAEGVAGARQDRLSVDLGEAVPARSRGQRGQVLVAVDQAKRLDLEARACRVRGSHDHVAGLRPRERREGLAERVGLEVVPWERRRDHAPARELRVLRRLGEASLEVALHAHADARAGREPRPDHHRV
jgi:hypothetical protein